MLQVFFFLIIFVIVSSPVLYVVFDERIKENKEKQNDLLSHAVWKDDLKAAQQALRMGANPNYEKSWTDHNSDIVYYSYPLGLAKSEEMKKLLQKYGATKTDWATEGR